MNFFEDTTIGEQLALESASVVDGIERYRKQAHDAIKRGAGGSLKASERMELHWYYLLARRIAAEKAACSKGLPGYDRITTSELFAQFKAKHLAVITMHATLSEVMAEPSGAKVTRVAYRIGLSACAELQLKAVKKNEEAWKKLVKTTRNDFRSEEINRIANMHCPEVSWTMKQKARLGARLLELLLLTATTGHHDEPFSPAFRRAITSRNGKSLGVIRATRALLDRLDESHIARGKFSPRHQPMILPPATWEEGQRGGYLRVQTDLIQHPAGIEKKDAPEIVMEAVNAIGKTPWRINKTILTVIQELWETGGNVAGLPRRFKRDKIVRPDNAKDDEDVMKAFKKEASARYRENMGIVSTASGFWQQLQMAIDFAERPNIYFPHSLDFRGRAYPLPLLNIQGADFARGVMELGEWKEPGPEGMRWIKIHLAGCCGVDKCDLDTRANWVDESMDVFKGWMEAPLDNTGWMEHDKPFQALAAAIALFSNDAAGRLPVQVDASNNAIQHYAAMLRCKKTASLVNLLPCDQPADTYSTIASGLADIVSAEADKGVPEAVEMDGKICRALVKQPVMTTVYGVTPNGMRKQVQAALAKAKIEVEDDFKTAKYLTGKIPVALGDTCAAATSAMDWLTECAKIISDEGRTVRWLTPLGFDAEQHYRNGRKFHVETHLQTLTLNHIGEECAVAKGQQNRGLAPNFIHSIDATHMLATAVELGMRNIAIAAIHDAFLSHAADMPEVIEVLKDVFVGLHDEPLLNDLYAQFKDRHPDLTFPEPPGLGDLDLAECVQSEYMFS